MLVEEYNNSTDESYYPCKEKQYFENEFVKMTLCSLRKDRYNTRITLVIIIENLTDKDLLFAFELHSSSLTGNRGSIAKESEIKGAKRVHEYATRRRKYYSIFNPGAQIPVKIQFDYEFEVPDSEFTFSTTFFVFDKERKMRFSTKIDGIKIVCDHDVFRI